MIDGYLVCGWGNEFKERDNHPQCIQVCGVVHTALPSKRVKQPCTSVICTGP